MPHEQAQTYYQNPGDKVAEAFSNAEEAIYTITEMPEFAQACTQNHLDAIKSAHAPEYWQIVSNFAIEEIGKRRAEGEDSLELAAFEISALTPSYLFASRTLAHHEARNYKEARYLKERASYFNGLLRDAGATFEGMRASETSKAMETVAFMAGLSDSATIEQIKWTVRGAQHELAFGQILNHTSHNFTPATIEQDMRGIDYTINLGSETMLIDVKASLSEIEALGGGRGAFALRRSPTNPHRTPVVVMYSYVKDHEFNDHFTIPDELAASRAPVVNELLQKADFLIHAA